MSKLWITVRMDDGEPAAVAVHGAEDYPHPHADYRGNDKPNPSATVAVDVEVSAELSAALQAALDGAREQVTADARLAAMRATVRAADRPRGDREIAVGGETAPTGADPASRE